jgi:pimeloyl-ACP methyl ester carboxylesterase
MRARSLLAAGCVGLLLAAGAAAAKTNRADEAQWVYQGVRVVTEIDADIHHYKWEIARPPYGPYDRIRVHRYVKEPRNDKAIPGRPAPDHRKVLFIINGTWGQEGNRRQSEESDTGFFPQQGYDVWTMDFRTSFVPNMAYDQFEELGESEGLQSTANWTYGVFREDIKAAVEFAKGVARTDKLFMAGRSRGGTQLFIYSAKYASDLKGMIGLDGGPIYRNVDNPATQRSEAEFQATMQAFRAGAAGPLLTEVGGYADGQLGGALPYARAAVGRPLPSAAELPFGPPPDGSEIKTIADLAAYDSYYAWGAGRVTNVYTPYPGGNGETYMDKESLLSGRAIYTRYWPQVQNVEGSFLTGYANNPYLDYDDTEHVTVPVLFFVGELGCPNGACLNLPRPHSTGSDDFTVNYLPGYGHLDVYYGTHAVDDVKRPMLEWMNARR